MLYDAADRAEKLRLDGRCGEAASLAAMKGVPVATNVRLIALGAD